MPLSIEIADLLCKELEPLSLVQKSRLFDLSAVCAGFHFMKLIETVSEVQILAVVANIHMRTLKPEVEKGSGKQGKTPQKNLRTKKGFLIVCPNVAVQ